MKLFLIREASEIRGDISQGLGVIGTLAKKTAEVKILDNNSHHKTYTTEQILETIEDYQPDIVGFHVNAQNIFVTGVLVKSIIKRFPGICLIGGGLHTYSEPYEVADMGVHIVAVEEADLTIIPLLDALKPYCGTAEKFKISGLLAAELSRIPGLIFYDSEKGKWADTGKALLVQNMDDIPFLDHELFNLKDYIKSPRDHHYVTNTLITQRGCPFKCSFCQGDSKNAYRIARHSTVEYMIKYVEYLLEKYNHDYIIFYDANFTLNKKLILEFCRAMVESGLNRKVTFWCETNVVLPIDDELSHWLKMAGCVEVALGVERLELDALKRIGKNKDYKLIRNNILTLNKSGINVTVNALVGFPFDTVETIAEEERLFTEVRDIASSTMVSVLLPLPGTKVYEHTRYKKWYLEKEQMTWSPPFYHYAYNYNGDAWYKNYFDLDNSTMSAIRGMRERMYRRNIIEIDNMIVSALFAIVEGFARISLVLYCKYPRIEWFLFAPVKYAYHRMWKTMVNKFYVIHNEA